MSLRQEKKELEKKNQNLENQNLSERRANDVVIAQLRQEIGEFETKLAAMQQLKEKVLKKKVLIRKRNATLVELRQTITEKDNAIAEKGNVIAERDQSITALEEKFGAVEGTVNSQKKKILKLEKPLAGMAMKLTLEHDSDTDVEINEERD